MGRDYLNGDRVERAHLEEIAVVGAQEENLVLLAFEEKFRVHLVLASAASRIQQQEDQLLDLRNPKFLNCYSANSALMFRSSD